MINLGLGLTRLQGGGDSGPPAETIVRTELGAIADGGQGIGALELLNVVVPAGHVLLIAIAITGEGGQGFEVATYRENEPMTKVAEVASEDGKLTVAIFKHVSDDTAPGCIFFGWAIYQPYAGAMVAAEYGGLSDVVDQAAAAGGVGTSPDSTYTATTSQAHDLLFGVIGTAGPPNDAAGSWQDGMSAGARVGVGDVTVCDGYRIVSSTGAYRAAKTGITSRQWAAMLAAFKGN